MFELRLLKGDKQLPSFKSLKEAKEEAERLKLKYHIPVIIKDDGEKSSFFRNKRA